MISVYALASSISQEVIRLLTGRLLSEEQISKLSDGAFAPLLKTYLPAKRDRRDLSAKVEAALGHMDAAGQIIEELQKELELKKADLDSVSVDLKAKQQLVQDQEAALKVSEEQLKGMRGVFTNAIRAEANRGARTRRLVALLMWLITLLAGAWAGANYQSWVAWWERLFQR